MYNQIWYVQMAVYALLTVSSAISTGLFRRNNGVEGIELYIFLLKRGFLGFTSTFKVGRIY